MTAVWVGLGWLAIAAGLALLIGKAIRRADAEIDAALSTYVVEDHVPAGWAA